MRCLLKIKTHTTLSMTVETGDFDRFVQEGWLCKGCSRT